ncbi:MAG: exodeoxyribonuclease VII large subunit [Gammaproteobacteria bacterium]|jgi:exodeoxyribonuclease VII large subunit|nr:exodeoxyribonuclease VII large subunit [Gammaproteobacteria bacterium]MDP6732104.1 exodeoxyribonuclease VII large subunit [Gammaproteobacteria bacterium]
MPHFPANPANPEQELTEQMLTVTGLNRLARSLLEQHFPAVIVEGEISNLAQPASGHWYLTLKDKTSQIRCAMFVNRNRMVRFKPHNGLQIIVRGRLSIYEGRGDYQLIADSLEEAGAGALRRAFEELKLSLQTEGLFATAAKQEILSCYAHIGVVTSPSGAALQDILSVFARRFPATRITLFPVAVQGSGAATEIVHAIELANGLRNKLDLQALIVGRGGGSLEDLQAFNEEAVARAIYASELPITSAVGHEIDFTIADFVADLRAPTPSAAAEQMSPSQLDYFETLRGYEQQLGQIVFSQLQGARQRLNWLHRQLKRPDRRLQEHAQNLDRLEDQLLLATRTRIALWDGELQQLNRGLLASSPRQGIRQLIMQLDSSLHSLSQTMRTRLQSGRASLGELSRSLSAVNPLSTLSRGYSITYDADMKVIRRSDDVKIGGKIITRLARGRIVASIDSTHSEDL